MALLRKRSLHLERIVECPFSFALREAIEYFDRLDRTDERAIRLPYRKAGLPLRGALRHDVRWVTTIVDDDAECGRAHDAVKFSFRASSPLFPTFTGTLRLRIVSIERTRIVLDGEYSAALGLAGATCHALLGRTIARCTIDDFVDRFERSMLASHRAFVIHCQQSAAKLGSAAAANAATLVERSAKTSAT